MGHSRREPAITPSLTQLPGLFPLPQGLESKVRKCLAQTSSTGEQFASRLHPGPGAASNQVFAMAFPCAIPDALLFTISKFFRPGNCLRTLNLWYWNP